MSRAFVFERRHGNKNRGDRCNDVCVESSQYCLSHTYSVQRKQKRNRSVSTNNTPSQANPLLEDQRLGGFSDLLSEMMQRIVQLEARVKFLEAHSIDSTLPQLSTSEQPDPWARMPLTGEDDFFD